ncbi:pantoate--beta-alanine ligase [Bradyrhizobium yuanmingense]|uniref:pantoate--beta-alanine ligase n=1 Tax=Bradyrhizobium yuanmingense TaxID=108015 RepID=UPI0035184B14
MLQRGRRNARCTGELLTSPCAEAGRTVPQVADCSKWCSRIALFGQRDLSSAQLCAAWRVDLNSPIEIVIVRLCWKNGLAMSSRNRYLSSEEDVGSPHFSPQKTNFERGEGDVENLIAAEKTCLMEVDQLQYAESVDVVTLSPAQSPLRDQRSAMSGPRG